MCVKAWLEAELDAQLFLADPNNAAEVSKLAEQQTEQMDRKVLWASLYGENPKNAGGGEVMFNSTTSSMSARKS